MPSPLLKGIVFTYWTLGFRGALMSKISTMEFNYYIQLYLLRFFSLGWVFLVPGMVSSLPSTLFFLDLVFQFLPRVFSVPFGFFGSRRGCFRFPSKHGVSGSHLWVFSVPVFFLAVLVCYGCVSFRPVPVMGVFGSRRGGATASPPDASLTAMMVVIVVVHCCCCCCCCCCSCCSLLFWILWIVLVLVVLVP